MAKFIPEDVITNILKRVDVKTILSCTCVCKSWYILITSPHFILNNLNFTICNRKIAPLALLRGHIDDTERYTLHSDTDDESFGVVAKLDFPFKSTNSYFTIIGSCNGLVCLSDDRMYYIHTIILWNPCVKRSVLLPKPNLIYNSYGSFLQSLGFGYDRVADDYKVVRITYLDYNQVPPQVELYKLSTGVWRDISHLGLEHVVYCKRRQAYIHGANHWIARCADSYDLIVLFDMCGEVFREMRLPDILATSDPQTQKDMVVCMESLALITFNEYENLDSSFCVWVMKEYGVVESWTRHFSVGSISLWDGFRRPLWVRKCGEVLAVFEDGRLIAYSSDDEDQMKDLSLSGSIFGDYVRSVHVESYTESLVLLERGADFCDAVTCSRLPTLHGN